MELPTLRAELKNEMAPYKIPTVLKVVDGIERNAMGKVNKKVIVQKYWPDKAWAGEGEIFKSISEHTLYCRLNIDMRKRIYQTI